MAAAIRHIFIPHFMFLGNGFGIKTMNCMNMNYIRVSSAERFKRETFGKKIFVACFVHKNAFII